MFDLDYKNKDFDSLACLKRRLASQKTDQSPFLACFLLVGHENIQEADFHVCSVA